jgi:adenylate cyclase class 2
MRDPMADTTHQPMSHEIECKIPVADHQAVLARLREVDAEHLETVLQTDTYYDSADGRLREAGCGLRIRREQLLQPGSRHADHRPLVTFKGPRDTDATYKVRRETETRVDSGEAIDGVLQALDVQPRMVIQKRRASFRLGGCQVELDELPMLGSFVEIEGPEESDVEQAIELLGVTGEHVHESYLSQAKSRCGESNGCERLTFERCGDCDQEQQSR